LLADYAGPALWRCLWPVSHLRRQGYPVGWLHKENPSLADAIMPVQAVILHRVSWDHPDYAVGRAWFEALHLAGKAVWFEVDDDLFTEHCLPQVNVLNPEGRSWAQLDQERRDRIYALALCDGVTVSTQRVATIVRQYTDKPVIVVPNSIDWPGFQQVCRGAPRPTAALTIGWAGGKRLDTDLTAMAQAWARLAGRYPGVEFVVVGHHADLLRDAVPPERLHLIPWQPLQRYPRTYAGIDIGCAPLAPTRFNTAKSGIKLFEYAAAGAAVVASPTIYADYLRDGRDGYLVRDAAEWEGALARLVEDAPLRQALARRWAKRVQERHSLAANLGRWPDAWTQLWADFVRRPRLVAV
jgi:glycosyltransferase involved in cell wall biosynthesis